MHRPGGEEPTTAKERTVVCRCSEARWRACSDSGAARGGDRVYTGGRGGGRGVGSLAG